MYENFRKIYNEFLENKSDDPLSDTLQLFDILTKRSFKEIEASIADYTQIKFSQVVDDRKTGKPLEYIIGKAPFLGNLFFCSPDTLIPREETELLARTTIDYIEKKQQTDQTLKIIDMGTGCGNIAVSLALNSINTSIWASDLNKETAAVTQRNVDQYNLRNRVNVSSGDLFSPLRNKNLEKDIDIIVCNPPYLPTKTRENLPSVIKDFEPKEAFEAGAFGIDFYRRLISDSIEFLKPQGILLFEIGVGQGKLVTRLFSKKSDYSNLEYFKDGDDVRVISAMYSPAR